MEACEVDERELVEAAKREERERFRPTKEALEMLCDPSGEVASFLSVRFPISLKIARGVLEVLEHGSDKTRPEGEIQ